MNKKKEASNLSTKMASAVLWLIFTCITILSLAVAVKVGMWIMGI